MAAFTLHSEQHATHSPLKNLFNYLVDFKNFEGILPADKIADFMVLDDGCSFSIKGITPMTIKIVDKKEFEYILFSSEGLAKFNFQLKAFFIGSALENGQANIELSGDLNPFIKSMAEKPLQSLINAMSEKLSRLVI